MYSKILPPQQSQLDANLLQALHPHFGKTRKQLMAQRRPERVPSQIQHFGSLDSRVRFATSLCPQLLTFAPVVVFIIWFTYKHQSFFQAGQTPF